MMRPRVRRVSSWRTSAGRAAAVTMALGGLSALVFAPTIAGAATRPTTTSVISTTKNAKLGTILQAGEVVYTLKASKIACTAKCLKVWPPVLLPHGVQAPKAGPGVDASKLGTIAATGDARQITYSGKALYWFAKDKSPHQVKGNVTDKWGKWSTVVTVKSSSASSTSPATVTTPAPTTAAPSTEPVPAQTSPPQTEPQQTEPPVTSPPAPQPTSPPSTSPGTGGIAF
jgi:predicted lipoprotein with Yx(FWY)xxD motif